MRSVVDLWEAGLGRSSVERGLLMASEAPDASLGRRNAALLALRERLFGPDVEALARCPECGEVVEISFQTSDLAGGTFDGTFEHKGFRIECRLPNSLDLAYALRFSSEEEAARAIARRCIVRAFLDEEEVDSVPDAVLAAMGERMDSADPLTVPSVALACPECGTCTDALFDVADFVWRELATVARRSLADVHELAKAYGWTEDQVLKLSPTRRRMYLEMVRA